MKDENWDYQGKRKDQVNKSQQIAASVLICAGVFGAAVLLHELFNWIMA